MLNLNCYYSKKGAGRPKRADMDVSRLGISDVLEGSGGLACANVSQTAESWIQSQAALVPSPLRASSHLPLDVQSLQACTPVTEDAANLSLTREFSDEEWNHIFMRSETGNDLTFPALGEAPTVNMVYAQEAFGELEPATASRGELRNRKQKGRVPSPLAQPIENTGLQEADENLRQIDTPDQYASGLISRHNHEVHKADGHRGYPW
jgi:hypothetical protein